MGDGAEYVARCVDQPDLMLVDAFDLHGYAPSIASTGFYALAREGSFEPPSTLDVRDLRFLNAEVLPELFAFPRDTSRVRAASNELDDPVLVSYYLDEWARY